MNTCGDFWGSISKQFYTFSIATNVYRSRFHAVSIINCGGFMVRGSVRVISSPGICSFIWLLDVLRSSNVDSSRQRLWSRWTTVEGWTWVLLFGSLWGIELWWMEGFYGHPIGQLCRLNALTVRRFFPPKLEKLALSFQIKFVLVKKKK